MKSYIKFLAFAMVAIVSLSFVSCSDDDADSPYVSDIVGKWKLTEVKTSASGSYISWPFQATYASFHLSASNEGGWHSYSAMPPREIHGIVKRDTMHTTCSVLHYICSVLLLFAFNPDGFTIHAHL